MTSRLPYTKRAFTNKQAYVFGFWVVCVIFFVNERKGKKKDLFFFSTASSEPSSRQETLFPTGNKSTLSRLSCFFERTGVLL